MTCIIRFLIIPAQKFMGYLFSCSRIHLEGMTDVGVLGNVQHLKDLLSSYLYEEDWQFFLFCHAVWNQGVAQLTFFFIIC